MAYAMNSAMVIRFPWLPPRSQVKELLLHAIKTYSVIFFAFYLGYNLINLLIDKIKFLSNAN